MIDTPEVVKTQPVTMAKIYQVVPTNQIQKVMGRTLEELRNGIKEQGKTITGPWFVHHLKPPAQNFDFEVCIPVSEPIEPRERMQAGEWPAMNVVRTVYRGGYEGLPGAWAEFSKWIKAHGHNVEPDIWERYLAGPETGSDASAWVTEFNCRLVER
jgi:effector-binding domain-containing protein